MEIKLYFSILVGINLRVYQNWKFLLVASLPNANCNCILYFKRSLNLQGLGLSVNGLVPIEICIIYSDETELKYLSYRLNCADAAVVRLDVAALAAAAVTRPSLEKTLCTQLDVREARLLA